MSMIGPNEAQTIQCFSEFALLKYHSLNYSTIQDDSHKTSQDSTIWAPNLGKLTYTYSSNQYLTTSMCKKLITAIHTHMVSLLIVSPAAGSIGPQVSVYLGRTPPIGSGLQPSAYMSVAYLAGSLKAISSITDCKSTAYLLVPWFNTHCIGQVAESPFLSPYWCSAPWNWVRN